MGKLADNPNAEWLMIDASQINVHPHAAYGGQRESEDELNHRGPNTKLHLAVDQNGRPIRAIIRAGTTADCCQAEALRPGIQAQYLLADRGYYSKTISSNSQSS